MDQNTLVLLMAGAIVVAAAAIVVQLVLMVAMYLSTRAIRDQVTALVTKAEPALDSAQRLLEEARKAAGDISAKASDVIDLTRKQLVRVDEIMGEATTRTRVQMDRVELVLDEVVSRFQDTVALVHNGILTPIRQISGLTAGIRAALSSLGGQKTSVEHATHDEEMFI